MSKSRKKIPPPPGWQQRVCGHEESVLAKYTALLVSSARWCSRATRYHVEYDDALADLHETVMIAVRKYAVVNGGAEIPGPLVNVVIRRRAQRIVRNMNVPLRQFTFLESEEDPGAWQEQHPAPGPSPQQAVEERDEREVIDALAYLLRKNLSPAGFAILHLRHIEELSPPQISALVGVAPRRWDSQLAGAKKHARAFLSTLGIDEWEDIEATAAEELP